MLFFLLFPRRNRFGIPFGKYHIDIARPGGVPFLNGIRTWSYSENLNISIKRSTGERPLYGIHNLLAGSHQDSAGTNTRVLRFHLPIGYPLCSKSPPFGDNETFNNHLSAANETSLQPLRNVEISEALN